MSQVYNNIIVYTKSILCEIDISAIVSGSPTAKGETRRTSLSPTFCRKPCKSAERPGMLGPVGEYVRLLGAHLRPQWPRVLLLAVVLLGGSGLELLFPQLLRHFIDASRLPAVRDIQSSGAVDYTMRGYYEVKRAQMYAMIKALVVGASAWQGVSSIFTFALVSAMALGVYMFQTDRITIGTVYLILHYIRLLQSPLSRISSEVQDLQRARASIGRVNELVSTQSRVRDGAGVPVKHGAPDILFDEVSFSYDGAQSVLHDISFTLEQGRTLGLLGRTGSGKTTISRLLFRLYDADKGTIRLDDTNVTDMRLSDLRRRIGMVTQEVQLFNPESTEGHRWTA